MRVPLSWLSELTPVEGEPEDLADTFADLGLEVDGIGTIGQGMLESSNVAVVSEMVDLIVTQRAYEMNTKAIQASDDMLSQANNLRR